MTVPTISPRVSTLVQVLAPGSIILLLMLLPLLMASRASSQTRKPKPKQPSTNESTTKETIAKVPITQQGLLEALHIGGIPPKELAQTIRTRGVSFEMTAQIENELRAAGAKPVVIDAARANYRPLVGTLNVTATEPGAIMNVSGVGRYTDRITALKLAPGHYTVSGGKLGYRPDSREIDIKFSETTNVDLRLEPMTTEELLKFAREAYEQKNYPVTIALTRAILAKQPELPQATALLASSLYSQGDFDESITYFTKAISLGEPVQIAVQHKHGGSWNGKSLCSGRLTLTRESFEFYSNDFPDEGFRIPYTKIIELSVKDQLRLFFKVKLKLPKNKKESDEEYSFYSTDAVATGRIVTCPQCLSRMRVVLQLIRQLKPAN